MNGIVYWVWTYVALAVMREQDDGRVQMALLLLLLLKMDGISCANEKGYRSSVKRLSSVGWAVVAFEAFGVA